MCVCVYVDKWTAQLEPELEYPKDLTPLFICRL
jgi:hypothetical protein